ncbi:MAG: hypothetical protein JSW40_00280 [Candidatus Omnitrophota bacterium]|nr:MAG: hypothetical protein JSW40_00280 [Candidatus Omnitrophota bacterium]
MHRLRRFIFLLSILSLVFLCSDARTESSTGKESRFVNSPKFILYIPSGIETYKKYPIVVALSPGADAESMVAIWKNVSEKYKWIILASKEFRNGVDMNPVFSSIVSTLDFLSMNFPVDDSKVIVTGFSGGGMGSHFFSFLHPRIVSAVVINTGMMHQFQREKKYSCPRSKLAVFLASPTDFRYSEMKRDRMFLNDLGWKTKWIEFQGGHRIAPQSAYEKAAEWLNKQF